MPKLTRIDNNHSSSTETAVFADFQDTTNPEDSWLETRADKSRVVTLLDGTVCVFRPSTVKDVRELRASGITDEFEGTIRIAARTCIQWGDKPGITPVQLDNLELADFMRIGEALKSFLPQ